VRILALDYGAARTGVAVSDPTGTVARPVEVIQKAASDAGVRRVAELVQELGVELVVVGLPLTLRGERGLQAAATDDFVTAVRAAVDVPVDVFDERFTTALAARTPASAPEDARAAAHLLAGYLDWNRRREA
jgi:putative holliday junction resolvase